MEIEKSGIENLWALTELRWLYNETGDDTKAKEIIDRIILKYPDFGFGYRYEGYLLKQKKNYEDAINYYQKALDAQINTDYEKARFYSELTLLYDLIGKKADSKACATKAIDLYKSYWVPDWLKKQIKKLEDLLESQT
jgi:tetratricopeptide (TPR) repeat protein